MRNNPIQFAVVREDPTIEAKLIKSLAIKSALLVGSGGCTALTLSQRVPDCALTLFDLNRDQLDLIKRKVTALRSSAPLIKFNVENDNSQGLNQCGNFESLFTGLREFIWDFVADYKWFLESFETGTIDLEYITESKFWPAAFATFFNDELLATMFGPAAIQHAPPGSYPGYFRSALERGLTSQNIAANYFMHHIFLGHYLPSALPPYLRKTTGDYRFAYIEGSLQNVAAVKDAQLVHLSNLFDWMTDEQIKDTTSFLQQTLPVGSYVLLRQLNNRRDYLPIFGGDFSTNSRLNTVLTESEASMFYSQVSLFRKQAEVTLETLD